MARLPQDKKRESDIILHDLYLDGKLTVGGTTKTIYAIDNGTPVNSGEYFIRINPDPNYFEISILWEEGNPELTLNEFKDIGLFGQYRNDYNYMKLDNSGKSLIIVGSNGVEVWITL